MLYHVVKGPPKSSTPHYYKTVSILLEATIVCSTYKNVQIIEITRLESDTATTYLCSERPEGCNVSRSHLKGNSAQGPLVDQGGRAYGVNNSHVIVYVPPVGEKVWYKVISGIYQQVRSTGGVSQIASKEAPPSGYKG